MRYVPRQVHGVVAGVVPEVLHEAEDDGRGDREIVVDVPEEVGFVEMGQAVDGGPGLLEEPDDLELQEEHHRDRLAVRRRGQRPEGEDRPQPSSCAHRSGFYFSLYFRDIVALQLDAESGARNAMIMSLLRSTRSRLSASQHN